MKAAFALLADVRVHNLVRKLAWDIHQKYRTGIDASRLPPHISLKQPFEISDLSGLEHYMVELAGGIRPFRVELTHLELIETKMDDRATGILWLNVRETKRLRSIHNRLNRELTLRLGDVSAPFDGADYHFHMSVAIGGATITKYRRILNEFLGRLMNVRFVAREMVMFIYDDIDAPNAGFMVYRILPLGGSA